MGINGEGIGYLNGVPVFVNGAFPLETVDIEIIQELKSYSFAKATQIIEKSPFRVDPLCKVQSECGGCALMPLEMNEQLHQKQKLLLESLNKYTKKRVVSPNLIVPNMSPYYYRNQCKFVVKKVEGILQSGMYSPNSNHFVPIKHCVIHLPIIEEVRSKIMKILNQHSFPDFSSPHFKGIKHLVIRAYGEDVQCTLVTGNIEINKIIIDKIAQIKGIKSIYQNTNTQRKSREIFGPTSTILWGSKTITATIEGVDFVMSPQSFMQLNYSVAAKIYSTIDSMISPTGLIFEAYCGVGGISIFLKNKAKKIIGVDISRPSIDNARINAKINNAENLEFIVGDAEQIMGNILKDNVIDILIVDPPRSGLTKTFVDKIISSKIKRVIYISCNPSTLAKNLDILTSAYKVREIIPFDMFSNTPLIETIVDLIKT